MATSKPKPVPPRTVELFPGDAHMLQIGQGHYVVAGKTGARFITISLKMNI